MDQHLFVDQPASRFVGNSFEFTDRRPKVAAARGIPQWLGASWRGLFWVAVIAVAVSRIGYITTAEAGAGCGGCGGATFDDAARQSADEHRRGYRDSEREVKHMRNQRQRERDNPSANRAGYNAQRGSLKGRDPDYREN